MFIKRDIVIDKGFIEGRNTRLMGESKSALRGVEKRGSSGEGCV